MIIQTKQDPACREVEITIRYGKNEKTVHRILNLLQALDLKLPCSHGGTTQMVPISDIYYIESVDKKTFVYLEKEVCRTESRLYQLAAQLENHGFVQINKACILNIRRLESVRPLLNSRMEATLKNGERVCINRGYLEKVKQALKGEIPS